MTGYQLLSVASILIVIVNFILSMLDRGKKNQKENHQELIEYQIKELKEDYKNKTSELKEDYKNMASDIKDIKRMVYAQKESTLSIVKEEMNEHIRLYHSKEG